MWLAIIKQPVFTSYVATKFIVCTTQEFIIAMQQNNHYIIFVNDYNYESMNGNEDKPHARRLRERESTETNPLNRELLGYK